MRTVSAMSPLYFPSDPSLVPRPFGQLDHQTSNPVKHVGETFWKNTFLQATDGPAPLGLPRPQRRIKLGSYSQGGGHSGCTNFFLEGHSTLKFGVLCAFIANVIIKWGEDAPRGTGLSRGARAPL